LHPREEADLTDGQLLECFISRRDEAAFAVLVRRHGPMVWGVCRRVLHSHHDAEDAFQATFLVLVRKAASIVSRELLANWLYGVAHRTALKAKASAAKRQRKERPMAEMLEPEAALQDRCHDLLPLLDQALSKLPDKYRVPIILCDLEGKTRKEAARQLGCPEGTVAGRLARARTMLAKRLARHGVEISGASLAMVLAEVPASASVSTSVVSSTVEAATLIAAGQVATGSLISAHVAALTEGVLNTMLLTKLKIVTAVLLVAAVAGVSAGRLIYHTQAAEPANSQREAEPKAQDQPEPRRASETRQDKRSRPQKEDAVKKELEKLQGTWIGVGGEFRGKESSEEESRKAVHKLVISGDKFTWGTALHEDGNEVGLMRGTIKIDPTKRPKTMDLSFDREGNPALGKCIYELNSDTLKFCYGELDRPTKFKTTADSDAKLYIWERKKN
jgi:RNA polymerase sigma-70 factor (ECF subfamily)